MPCVFLEETERNNAYLERRAQATKLMGELEVAKRERLGKAKTIEGFIKDISTRPLALTEFDEKLWLAVIDTAEVGRDGRVTFRFRNGTEITV